MLAKWPSDSVFCRNVLMYFTPEMMNRVVARLGAALLPGGYLFLGHAETLRGLSHDYHLCHTHETFYYQKRLSTSDPPPAPGPELPRASEALPNVVDASSSWVEVIDRSSARIHALSSPRTTKGRTESSPALRPSAAVAGGARGHVRSRVRRVGW